MENPAFAGQSQNCNPSNARVILELFWWGCLGWGGLLSGPSAFPVRADAQDCTCSTSRLGAKGAKWGGIKNNNGLQCYRKLLQQHSRSDPRIATVLRLRWGTFSCLSLKLAAPRDPPPKKKVDKEAAQCTLATARADRASMLCVSSDSFEAPLTWIVLLRLKDFLVKKRMVVLIWK